MLLTTSKKKTWYTRKSKLGLEHRYCRTCEILHLQCDCCGKEFTRSKGKMSPKRASNNFCHVCDNCDVKKFAQSIAVTNKKIWLLDASSLKKV